MFIKTITIQGFKSYRDQVAVDPFSPGHNVIVGRNGSGKSNFFSAIRFVLSDQYTQMGREERQRLLHEGTSTSTTLAAYVEIVFDNTDGRFPTSLPEVRLRRTIGLKKDEYSLDKKSVTKAEVNNLLESAGFSKSNPYYIVPQGRITHLTNMGDKERLTLLKEVAGTKVYEQKRQESTKIMEETSSKREKITELLTAIEERLDELEQEKEELKEYQEKDRDRRCLEYALHNRELSDVTGALDQLENAHRSEQHNINLRQDEFNTQQESIQQYEDTLTTANHALSTSTIALRQYETEMADLIRTRTEIECVIADFKASQEGGEERRQGINEELEKLEERIEEANERLQKLEDELDQRIAEEKAAKETLDNTQSQLAVLYAKQGRSQLFTTQAQRDKYLNNEIRSLQTHEAAQEKQVATLEKEVANAKSQLSEVVVRSRAEVDEEEERRDLMKKMSDEVVEGKKKLEAMQEERKDLWREDGKLAGSVASARQEMESAERGLAGIMDRDTSNGLKSVRSVANRLKMDGVYGPLYDLFEVSDRYKQAVEITAGTSLFHVVVDNDETASRILEVMNKEKLGRVTFMPLNRLRSVNVQMPKANDAVPLMSKLRFEKNYSLAFEQVFGRTIVCEDLATAAQYTRSHGVNAVTVDGDRVDRKGALTGGFHDVKKSRLDMIKTLKKWREAYDTDSARYKEVKDGLAKIDQNITKLAGDIQVLEAKRRQALDVRARFSKQSQWTKKEEDSLRSRLEQLEMQLASAEAELKAAAVKRSADEEELKTPMRQTLTDAEIKSLDALTKASGEQKKKLVEKSLARSGATSAKRNLDSELTESLRRKREELRVKVDQVDSEGSGLQAGDVQEKDAELRQLVRSIDGLAQQIKESEKKVEQLSAEISEVTAKLDEVSNEQMESGRAMLRMTKNNERYLAKKQTLGSRRDECQNAIRDLGVLPEEAYNKYTEARADKLVKKLHKVNDSLKKFAHVNKKAFEQYNNFTKQRDEHLERREELDASATSIQELIETLDQRKDEAIERTFKQVSKYFEEVFETLVPAGKGMLVMQKKADGYIDEESEDQNPDKEKSEIDNYTGISIKVSFNSKADEGQRIQQLSGGQKSLVALATVFAIQKCDPAPFYLFDEIDANLDAQYRTAVAAMIHTLSDTAQFVTTTFRSEMLAQADKFYGVYFDRQKVSTIATIEREEAYEFVENAAQVGGL